MFKIALLSVSLLAGLSSASSALTVSSFVGDSTFTSTCKLGTPNPQACEHAVAEFRGGNAAVNGTYEQSLNTPTVFGAVQAQFAWVKGMTYDFALSHLANGTLRFSLGSGPQTISMPNPTGTYDGLADANTMFIRIRNNAATETVSLTDMYLGATSIGSLVFGQSTSNGTVGSGSNGAGYLQIAGFDFSAPWTLTGKVRLDWAGASVPGNSNLGANFKLASVPTPIPLPASALLLLTVAGGLAVLKRRRA